MIRKYKTLKKSISIITCLVMIFAIAPPVHATESLIEQDVPVVFNFEFDEEKSVDEIRAMTEAALVAELVQSRISNPIRAEWGPVGRAHPSGRIGLQPPTGVHFHPFGGSVHVTRSGGPSGSVSIGLPTQWGASVSVGVSFGNRTDSFTGYNANIPGWGSWFVYRDITVEVHPFRVYEHTGAGWVLLSRGHSTVQFTRGFTVRPA